MRQLNCRHMGVMVAAAMSAGVIATPALAIEFPFHANDLVPGERYSTGVHSTSDVAQTGGKDILLRRWVADNNWPRLKAGQTDEAVNSNYLIYGRPVYAMAGGTVVACWRNAPENTGHTLHPQNATGKILLQGNHLWIKQTDGNYALYAHAQTGDIPASLCPNNAALLTGTKLNYPTWTQPEATVAGGATVSAGQLLYHVGNAGNASEPHLHVHVVNASNAWQPMNFARGQTTPFTNGTTASLNGPWTGVKGNALPMASILVWPPHPIGNWTYNGIESAAFQRVFEHFVDSGMMADTITCKNNGASYDTTWVPAKGYWLAQAGMTVAEHATKNQQYTQQGYKEVAVYTCGTVMAAVWRKP